MFVSKHIHSLVDVTFTVRVAFMEHLSSAPSSLVVMVRRPWTMDVVGVLLMLI